jgi:Fe-S cluster assembly protein SufD
MTTPVAERNEKLASFVAGFDALKRDAAFGPDWLRTIREAAFQRFLDRGFPSTRDEEWRFTNVAPIAAMAFERAASANVPPRVVDGYRIQGAAAEVVVVNGQVNAPLSSLSLLPPGVTVKTGVAALRAGCEGPASVDEGLGRGAFVDLNAAFFEDVVVIEVAQKAIVREPLHVLFVSSADGRPVLAAPRLVVRAGEQSQCAVVETWIGAGGTALTTAVTSLVAEPGAVVEHVKLQNEPDGVFHLASLFAHLMRASNVRSHAITLGGRIARNDIVATLDGEGAECTLNGLYVAGGESLVDTHSTIDHARPHCPSHELYKGILAGRARAVFNGKIIVRPDAQKTDAKQTNKALLLTDDAQINTKPQLEIFADDVKCTHGAAIGQLDEDAMFYLRARGIAEIDARNLLIHAFAGEVLDRIAVEEVRDRAMRLMEEKLRLPH